MIQIYYCWAYSIYPKDFILYNWPKCREWKLKYSALSGAYMWRLSPKAQTSMQGRRWEHSKRQRWWTTTHEQWVSSRHSRKANTWAHRENVTRPYTRPRPDMESRDVHEIMPLAEDLVVIPCACEKGESVFLKSFAPSKLHTSRKALHLRIYGCTDWTR